MRIAFFGGSFDPPHLGHLAVARAAAQALSLDRVLFAPVGLQPLKPAGSSARFEDRVNMTRLAIQDDPPFQLSLADAPNPASTQPNFTVDTLTTLRSQSPAATRWFLLLGADAFLTFHHWHRAAEIPFLADLVIASRPAAPPLEATTLALSLPPGLSVEPSGSHSNLYRITNLQGAQASLTFLPNLDCDISATQLRNQLDAAEIPTAVLQYIRHHRLYETLSTHH